MADEYVILNHNSLADESMGGNLAAGANRGVLLNFDERADFGVIPYGASVQIHQSRLRYLDVISQPNAVGDRHALALLVRLPEELEPSSRAGACGRRRSDSCYFRSQWVRMKSELELVHGLEQRHR
jgi:hypothetical protein